MSSDLEAALDGHEFAVCLTHDVDRVRKTFQTVYYAVRDRDPGHLRALLPGVEPYWQFETVMRLEADLGVRSAFYFLDEQSLWERPMREWVDPERWKLHTARYDVEAPRIAETITALDRGGWEVGLHGSYDSYRDRSLLAEQKATLEGILGHPLTGGRQHYLNLEVPDTWRRQADVGLSYDASLGSSTRYGFQHGYGPCRPFDDDFVVFPLTLMEVALPDPAPGASGTAHAGPEIGMAADGTEAAEETGGGPCAEGASEGVTATDGGTTPAVSAAAREVCDDLLREAQANDAVMTVLWHPRYFSAEFPGYRECYCYLVERALEMEAWVGPPGELYARLPDR